MGGAKACCFVILMALAVLVFWSCGLVLSVYEIAVGAYAFDSKNSKTTAANVNVTNPNSTAPSSAFGPCSWKQSDDKVDLVPLYLIVSGLIWLLWTVCSALIRCSDAERSTGFYIGSGDLKVHCVTNGESKTRHIIRKFLASLLLVCAVAWTVAGSIFTFLGRADRSSCADNTYQSARITIIIRWAWIAFIVLVSLLLKVMQCALASRRNAAGAAQTADGEKGKAGY